MNSNNNKKVYVGLSGGVDSSVSALLLKKQGFSVYGVYIKGWQPDWIECTWKDDRVSAMRSAAELDIPFLTLDLESVYRDEVAKYMIEEYKNGRTPNGDMLCNREVKFGAFLKWAMESGADFVATGHYAQLKKVGDEFVMFGAQDKEKDQSYFLSQIKKEDFTKILFPVGDLLKSEVRKIAQENNLTVSNRKDSQGICFVGDMDIKEFLKKEVDIKSGNVLNENGEVVGTHEGSLLYTIGERHGFKLHMKDENLSRYFVVSKDVDKNTITVSKNEKQKNNSNIVLLKDFNLLSSKLEIDRKVFLRMRYRGEKMECKILEVSDTAVKVEILNSKINNFAEGQFGVLYSEDEVCLGGGVY